MVVWLQVDARESWRRIAHSDRPLATSAEDVARLMAVRQPLYEELADALVPVGDRGIVARALPALQALADLPAGTKLLWATSASGEYPILVGAGLLEALADPAPRRSGGPLPGAASASPTRRPRRSTPSACNRSRPAPR